MISKAIRHARRSYNALRPLFPGYIFVEQPNSLQRWRPLLSTSGVKTVVMSGEKPALLPAGFVEELMAREANGSPRGFETLFQIGQQVTIRGGAFDGLIGDIIDLKEKDRVVVLLNLLQRRIPVHVNAKMLV
jgi:transcriptional antiterminator RfaH